MSFQSTASVNLEAAIADVSQAIEKLSTIVVKRCSGHDDFTSENRQAIREAYFDLIRLREKIDWR